MGLHPGVNYMFFISLTDFEINEDFHPGRVEIRKSNGHYITIVTDGFLSDLFQDENGFTIIESPLLGTSNVNRIIFCRVSLDRKKNNLIIHKSTIAGRPIYYYFDKKGNFFCSTHIEYLRKSGVPIEENISVLPEFFLYRYIIPPRTMYKDINQVLIGDIITIDIRDGRCKIKKIESYIPPKANKNIAKEHKNLFNEIGMIIDGAIKDLDIRQEKISVLLSGGLDSSILFKLCQENFKVDKSYSTGYPFDPPEKNKERSYSISAGEAFNSDHKYYEVSNEEYQKGFIEAVQAAEEPIHHLQSVMFQLLFKNCIPTNKNIIISGEGADGVWGFSFHQTLYRNSKLFYRILSQEPFLRLLKIMSKLTGRGIGIVESLALTKEKRDLPLTDPNNIIYFADRYGDSKWICEYYKVNEDNINRGRYEIIKSFKGQSLYDLSTLIDMYGDLSVTQSLWSKIGEANGMILYYPFYKLELLNYSFSIPWDIKLKEPKKVLREVARSHMIPDFIINRPKSGFSAKPERWALKNMIFEPLIPLASKVIDEKHIRRMQTSDLMEAMTYWNILNYSIWKRLFINNEPIDILMDEINI
jgi:asparagine synthetase B (glutamine-hydrolysing)